VVASVQHSLLPNILSCPDSTFNNFFFTVFNYYYICVVPAIPFTGQYFAPFVPIAAHPYGYSARAFIPSGPYAFRY